MTFLLYRQTKDIVLRLRRDPCQDIDCKLFDYPFILLAACKLDFHLEDLKPRYRGGSVRPTAHVSVQDLHKCPNVVSTDVNVQSRRDLPGIETRVTGCSAGPRVVQRRPVCHAPASVATAPAPLDGSTTTAFANVATTEAAWRSRTVQQLESVIHTDSG